MTSKSRVYNEDRKYNWKASKDGQVIPRKGAFFVVVLFFSGNKDLRIT